MIAKPDNWSVQIVGSWNPAILTPGGIAKRLFQLEEGTAINVEIAVDALEPPRVTYDGIIVTAGSDRLLITLKSSRFSELNKALEIGRNAIASLPETPLTAAGFNANYKIVAPTDALLEIFTSGIDDLLSDFEFEIRSRRIRRDLRSKHNVFAKGQLNLSAVIDENHEVFLEFNFHRGSKDRNELKEWLNIHQVDIAGEIEPFLEALNISIDEEASNDQAH